MHGDRESGEVNLLAKREELTAAKPRLRHNFEAFQREFQNYLAMSRQFQADPQDRTPAQQVKPRALTAE